MNICKTYVITCLILFASSGFTQELNVIPYPEQVRWGSGKFTFNSNTEVVFTDGTTQWHSVLQLFFEKIAFSAGFKIAQRSSTPASNFILVQKNHHSAAPGTYTLDITKDYIKIIASDPSGIFYAAQTLLQLLPHHIESNRRVQDIVWQIPSVLIQDSPAFQYRGLMLDLSRHFFSLDFIKKIVDLMAMQKMNNLHLHLTDDQGWRMEIKKYPRLTSTGGSRNGTLVGKYPGNGSDNVIHKGFYTQEELKELVHYAQQRFIQVIPEIELPGHSSAAIAAYPSLSCFPAESSEATREMLADKTLQQLKTPGTKIVQETWGVFNDVLCPTEFTFQFIQDVMDEVMNVFPSKYIHIGGDECPKDYWKKSPFCQQLIRSKGLKDEHELQSYFIQRVEKYVNSKGRNIIGWDEILEGGLAPNATVMSWRGISGGVASAKQAHDVVMSPVDFCYLNLYQSEDPTDSIAWGGLLPLKKVYNYDPIPKELSEKEVEYIKGVQANLWSEYIKSPALAEFMLFPRLLAIAELGWSSNKPGFDHFTKRAASFFYRLDQKQVNYSSHLFDLNITGGTDEKTGLMYAKITGVPEGLPVYYSINGSEKKPFRAAFLIKETSSVLAQVEINGLVTDKKTAVFNLNKATGKPAFLKTMPSEPYHIGGEKALTNGIVGSSIRFNDNEWLGWNGHDFEGIIDFKQDQVLKSISLKFFNSPNNWVYAPSSVTVYGSQDGTLYNVIATKNIPVSKTIGVQSIFLDFVSSKVRYLKILAFNHGIIQTGNPGQGSPSWLFVDEIIVD